MSLSKKRKRIERISKSTYYIIPLEEKERKHDNGQSHLYFGSHVKTYMDLVEKINELAFSLPWMKRKRA